MKKLKVYLRIPSVADCGVGYYRQYLPLMTARKKKELSFICQHFSFGEDKAAERMITDKELATSGKWADLAYFSRNDVPQYISQAGAIRDMYHIPVVLDIDDNVQATRPYNPGYRSFHPGSPNMVWNIKSLGIFDAITVSTENLKRYYSDYTDPNKIYVCPNSLDWKERDEWYNADFSKSELFKKQPGEIRIGWAGSAAHWENLKHIEEAVVQILKDYPQTTFYYTGLFGDLFQDPAIKDRVHLVGWAALKDWARYNREMNFDIALAPLTDNMFNRAKSNLRILEYASARYAVIASPVEPYQTFTPYEVMFALEAEDWYSAMAKLIERPEKRKELADNLYKDAKKRFDIDKNYKIWLDSFVDIKKKFNKVHLPIK